MSTAKFGTVSLKQAKAIQALRLAIRLLEGRPENVTALLNEALADMDQANDILHDIKRSIMDHFA